MPAQFEEQVKRGDGVGLQARIKEGELLLFYFVFLLFKRHFKLIFKIILNYF